MAVGLKNRPDESTDYNPSRQNVGDRDFNDIIDNSYSQPAIKDEDRNTRQGDGWDSSSFLSDAEKNPESNSNGDSVSRQESSPPKNSFYSQDSNKTSEKQKNKWGLKNLNGKQKGGIIGIVAALLLGGGGIFGLGALPGLTLVNFKEVLSSKYGSNIDTILSNRSDKIWVKKLTSSAQKGIPIGKTCQNIRAMCKFDGLSDKDIQKFKERGGIEFETTGEKTRTGKNRISAIIYRGEKMDAATFARRLKTDPGLAKSVNATFKSRFSIWSNKQFKKLAAKVKISKSKQSSAEKNKEKVMESIKEGNKGNTESKYNTSKAAAEEGKELSNAEKKANQLLDEMGGGDNLTRDTVTSISKNVTQNIGKTIMITGAIDSACTALNILSAVGYASKIIGQEQLIRFAFQFMNTADAVKAGEATPEAMEVWGSMLTQKSVDDGRTAFDSYGYQYMAYDKLGNIDDAAEFKSGGGLTGTLLDIRSNISNAVGGVDQGVCNFIQNPFVRVGSGIVGILASIFTAGGTTVAQVAGSFALSMAFSAAQAFAIPLLSDLVAGNLINDDVMADGNRVGNALVSGGGATFSQNAGYQALQPLTVDQAMAFKNGPAQEYLAMKKKIERADASPFDIYNPYTATGSIAMKLTTYTTGSATSVVGKVISLGASSLLNPLKYITGTNVSAADEREYKLCPDEEYKELNLATDPFCNVVYGLSPDLLAMDPDQVRMEMIDGGYVDSETGEPIGRYEEFLNTCVDSAAPFGDFSNEETGDSMKPKKCMPGKGSPKYPEIFWVYAIDDIIGDSQDCLVGDEASSCTDDSGEGDSVVSDDQEAGSPDNVRPLNVGWTLKPNTNYSNIPCAAGTTETRTYTHPLHKYAIKLCKPAGQSQEVASIISQNVVNMFNDAKSANVTLRIASGFRSYEEQQAVRASKGGIAAPPGVSQHERGLAIDLNTNCGKSPSGCRSSRSSAVFNWLDANASKYGFHVLEKNNPEAWHWSTSGY